ncbi:predicted protein [Naegleria gruberi]|uniref:Predicted protein n=1 Tax=Naegleria gruberi TaxID=5762 RepID=D2VLA7_NAEGR|nr:uncharacterized protein NAEGRDRAFT_69714 [Naegleria gruberi]EFC42278.1 predicted protein [Naegleria gruberi]|eukprot:XP_002675022.1 predicted protein [Naegleria gruberi strain NEG-M]
MEITKINDYIFKISNQKRQTNETDVSFEWFILRMDYSSAETDGLIYFDFLVRNQTFLKVHLPHYPNEAYENLSWSVNRMKRLSSAHNYFVLVKSEQTPSYIEKVNQSEPVFEFLKDKLTIGVCGGFTGGKTEFDLMEVGYALDEKFQSHGIVSNTLKFIIEKAFKEVSSLNLIKLVCNDYNVKSAAVGKRLGFTFNEEESEKASKEDNVALHCFTMTREEATKLFQL